MQKVEISPANGKQPVNTSVIIAIVKSIEGPPLPSIRPSQYSLTSKARAHNKTKTEG